MHLLIGRTHESNGEEACEEDWTHGSKWIGMERSCLPSTVVVQIQAHIRNSTVFERISK
jgi:hypothetical protein